MPLNATLPCTLNAFLFNARRALSSVLWAAAICEGVLLEFAVTVARLVSAVSHAVYVAVRSLSMNSDRVEPALKVSDSKPLSSTWSEPSVALPAMSSPPLPTTMRSFPAPKLKGLELLPYQHPTPLLQLFCLYWTRVGMSESGILGVRVNLPPPEIFTVSSPRPSDRAPVTSAPLILSATLKLASAAVVTTFPAVTTPSVRLMVAVCELLPDVLANSTAL